MRAAALILLLGLLTAAAPAQGSPRPVQAPLPAVVPPIHQEGTGKCGVAGGEAAGCYRDSVCYSGEPGIAPVIYLARWLAVDAWLERVVRAHELGHAFECQHMSGVDRGHFLWLLGLKGRAWWTDVPGRYGPPGEVFADAYAMCRHRWTPAGGPWSTVYGYLPSARRHARVCRGMVRWQLSP